MALDLLSEFPIWIRYRHDIGRKIMYMVVVTGQKLGFAQNLGNNPKSILVGLDEARVLKQLGPAGRSLGAEG